MILMLRPTLSYEKILLLRPALIFACNHPLMSSFFSLFFRCDIGVVGVLFNATTTEVQPHWT